MKTLVLFLFLLSVVFSGAFFAARAVDQRLLSKPQKEIAIAPKYTPSPFPLVNHPFTVVIVGVNNGAHVAKTLASVFSQNYENYKVIYIDDASDDGSYDVARDLIYASDHLGQVTLVGNEERLGLLANILRAVQTCKEEEIVVVLNGEDWLAHEWVLQRLNAYYADPDIWITYGQYRDFPNFQLGHCHEETMVRSRPFVASHLKTFYAALFKKVRESDFVSAGKFLPACSEMAYMIPMLELAQDHAHFIPEILYISNRQATYKEDRELQMRCEKFIRALDPYPPLTALQVTACGE